tara:strand:+ start:1842 stop:2150 length:309 start_codon:yes stop_codon:yes gene_type:complete
MINTNLDDKAELTEFLEQVNYSLSLEFKERWRHRFSESFITIFQDCIIKSFQTQKPIKLSVLMSQFTKKHRYDEELVKDFLECIDMTLYYPLIYRDRAKKTS